MKKLPMLSRIYIVILLLVSTTAVIAGDCCPSICDWFNCGNWAYQNRIGVYPTIWRERGHLFLNTDDCNVTGTDLGELPKFNKFYKIPWYIGTQLQYEWCDCVTVYGELNYIQANHKKKAHNTNQAVNSALAIRLGQYRAISAYVGLMYNFGNWCWCDTVDFFVGAKIGFIHRNTILAHTLATTPALSACACDEFFKRDFFKHATKISGGLNLGLSYCLCDRWSLILTGEAVVSGGPKGAACVPLLASEITSLGSGTQLGVQKIKTEISFPITLGLKYNF